MINGLVDGEFKTDLASPKLQESYQEWTSGAQQMMQGLDGMAGFLNQAVGAFQDLGTQLSQGAGGRGFPAMTQLSQYLDSGDWPVVDRWANPVPGYPDGVYSEQLSRPGD